MLHGKCLCESVRYEVSGKLGPLGYCHCSQCRRATGAAFKPFAGIERGKFRIESGEGKLLIYGNAANHDAHCSVCGSFLFSVVRDGNFVHVNLGALKDKPTLRPTAHIHVGSKAAWYTIADDLPQHEALP